MSTNLFCLFYRYVDFTSLYPWCNKNTQNVVGHPQIITENFADISTYFGLIKCTILPPRGLLHPVLPYRTKENLMFPLCKTCADTKNKNPCTPHRSRESYSWHVVSCRGDESYRERVRTVKHSRSMALGGNNRRAVQRVRQHVF